MCLLCVPRSAHADLCTAVDNSTLSWTAGGSAIWSGQSLTPFFDYDAAQSGTVTDSQSAYRETTVAGPGVLIIYWKESSQESSDFLSFKINRSKSDSISGEKA